MLPRSPKSAIKQIVLFLPLLLATFAATCRSAELAFEVGRTVIHGEASSVAISTSFGHQRNVGRDHQDFNFECGLFLNGSNEPNPNNLGGKCIVVDEFKRFDIGLGLAYLQNTDQWNGSHLNFSLLARWWIKNRWALVWDHVSNAGTVYPNIGRDAVRLRYTF